MGRYVAEIICAAAAAGVVGLLVPDDENGVGRYVRYLSYLLIVIVVTSPFGKIREIVSSVRSDPAEPGAVTVSGGTDEYGELIMKRAAENIADRVISVCRERFGVDEEAIRVHVILDDGDRRNIVIDEIQIFLGVRVDSYKDGRIERYFRDELGCPVHVFAE